ncbi:MAG: CHASE2 domain-containing protein [Pseudomonadota bacterium]
MGWLKEVLSAARVAAVVVLLGAAIATLDPMGLDDAADRHSADVIARMTAPYYADKTAPLGRSKITAVEISDATLREMAIDWPAPRGFYTDLLRTLAPADGTGPAAIFLDYILLTDLGKPEEHRVFIATVREVTRAREWEGDPGCRDTPLAKIQCIVRAGGTPVILGKPYPPDVCAAGLGDDLAPLMALEQSAVVVPLGWPQAGERATPVLTRLSYMLHLNGTYGRERGEEILKSCRQLQPMIRDGRHREAAPFDADSRPMTWWGVPKYDLTPAGAMFAALCRGRRAADGSPLAVCNDLIGADGKLHWLGPEASAVTWGSVPDPAFLDLRAAIYEDAADHDAPCRAERTGVGRMMMLGWRQLTSAIGDGVAAVQVPCPYHPTFDYGMLSTELAEDSERARLIRERYIAGRVIVVGAAMVASTDWTDTVVNGRLAGVHYHAMMLDNLVEHGAAVLRAPPALFPPDNPLSSLNIDWGEMLEFATAFLVVLVVELGRRRMERRERRDGRALLWVIGVFVWAGVLMTVATAITISLHWKPVNIIGLFTLTLVDAAASFWSIAGLTWVVSTGWLGARTQGRRATRLATNVILRLASRAGMLFSSLRKTSRPSQPEDGDAPVRAEGPGAVGPHGERSS